MNRITRIILMCIGDAFISAVSVLSSLGICGFYGSADFSDAEIKAKLFYLFVPIAAFILFNFVFNYMLKMYHVIWKYATVFEYIKLVFVNFSAALICYFVMFAVRRLEFNNMLIMFLIGTVLSVGTRVIIAYLSNNKNDGNASSSGNIMVIGAGDTGVALIRDIVNNGGKDSKVKCIIDDDISKHGGYIGDIKIVGGCEEIVSAAESYNINTIVFAIPSCKSNRKAAILNICQKTDCAIRTVPSFSQLMSGESVKVSGLRKVEIEDLLGRDPIDIKVDSVMGYVKDKVVMVTGGGGSIGSELCRQIAAHEPKQLIIFDIYENNAYDIQNELKRDYPELDLYTLIGSVRDIKRLDSVFDRFKPQIIYHAAAHKHVPLMEDSPNESIKNNVFGTLNAARCADKYGVERFILISTDKAVNPTNIMGASKRICEMVIQTYNERSKTDFVAVRFGNVLGSNGSVIPLFKKQIELGGPVTVTDPNIIRYFMTIPEAVSLVLQAGATAKGGEIFVLDMGEPVKIVDLAEKLIKLSGFKPYSEIKIEFTGLRPGEKLFEEKIMSEEGLVRTSNRLIHIGRPIEFDREQFVSTLTELEKAMSDDNCDIRALVHSIVPTYTYFSK